MGEVRGTTEEFIPRGLHYLACKVSKIDISLKRVNLLQVEIEYKLEGTQKILNTLYFKEGWKLTHLEDAAKRAGQRIDFPFSPSFVAFTNASLRVIPDSLGLKINDRDSLVLLNDTAELVGLPDSYPPLTETPKPAEEKHSFFWAKSTVFFTPMVLGATYKLTYQVEAINYYYELGFLFPFRFVDINMVNLTSETSYDLATRKMRLMKPFRQDTFPPRQEYEWFRTHLTHKTLRPSIARADPFRLQPMLGEDFVKEQPIRNNEAIDLHLSNYEAFQVLGLLKKPTNKDLISVVQTTESPIPIRIYEQLQKLPRYRDFLISFDLFNISDKPIELELSSQIKGYTDVAIDNVTLPIYGDKSSHTVTSQVPRLKRGILSKVPSAIEATLEYKIRQKESTSWKTIERGTRTVKFLPQDMIIWEIRDPKSSNIYDLSKMLGAWITPSDTKGLLDKVRAKAAELHPDGYLGGEQGDTSLSEKTTQVKALYDYLNTKLKIKYVNQPFSFDFNAGGQRVLTPERVISIKAGNCIDLVVLFASLMEGLGIRPLILLMPGHAFLGWGNKYKTSEMGFLECTTLGVTDRTTGEKVSFERSYQVAEKTYKEKFLYIGSEDYLPLHSVTYKGERGFIVDLDEIRKEGIFRAS